METLKVVDFNLHRAKKYLKQGVDLAAQGEFRKALVCFQRSALTHESAEAYTYWAWMLSIYDQLDASIELCTKAIELDPDFGNPYNDIGTYFLRLGKMDQAIQWLEKAKCAKNYKSRHYPHMNLGRIYLNKGNFEKAIIEFDAALEYDPRNTDLQRVLSKLKTFKLSDKQS